MANEPALLEVIRALDEIAPCDSKEGSAATATMDREELSKASRALVTGWARFQKAGRVPGVREHLLLDLIQTAERIRDGAKLPHLRPVLLLITALHGLLKQLSIKSAKVTSSELRTAAGAIDLLDLMCNRAFRPDLATEPRIRLLVVDDEPFTRGALSSALKKTFHEPDLAPDGKIALSLVEKHRYDLILLDVEMPGLDGFEVCLRIHDTAENFTTPVVFVTGHCDFDARTNSARVGAHELIGKPFGAFEIMLKALTLVLKNRLAIDDQKAAAEKTVESSSAVKAQPGAVEDNRGAQSAATAPTEAKGTKESPVAAKVPTQVAQSTSPTDKDKVPDPASSAELPEAPKDDFGEVFFAPIRLLPLRESLILARNTANPAERDKVLRDVYAGFHTLCEETGRMQRGALFRVAFALEALLKKVIDRPAYCTPCVFHSALTAFYTIDELCRERKTIDLTEPPIRVLVVDDDPVSRRAFSGAIQLSIARPDSADCGAAALALAREKPYDVIFLDVIMPGMDGFETCTKLHELPLNRSTPVVFITGQDDANARAKAAASGACGFIPKPVLPCEVLLVALTFIIHGRLERLTEAPLDDGNPAPAGEKLIPV